MVLFLLVVVEVFLLVVDVFLLVVDVFLLVVEVFLLVEAARKRVSKAFELTAEANQPLTRLGQGSR